jgi:hypothetical protein
VFSGDFSYLFPWEIHYGWGIYHVNPPLVKHKCLTKSMGNPLRLGNPDFWEYLFDFWDSLIETDRQDACQLMRMMEETNVRADVVCYSAAISASNKGDLDLRVS